MKYIHEESIHNLKDPKIIVPELIKIINPKSVVDIGCGVGNFLAVFKENGVNDVLGIDGSWVDKKLLSKYLEKSEFIECDLEQKLKLDNKYDLVCNLEVAEHLSSDKAELHVQNLINAGHIIVFSAAIPNQGGQNHINEQWPTYWIKLFKKHDYKPHDILRPIFWNTKLQRWYKQNMIIFAPKNFEFNTTLQYSNLDDVVHPEVFQSNILYLEERIKDFSNGKIPVSFALKILIKSIIGIKLWRHIKATFK